MRAPPALAPLAGARAGWRCSSSCSSCSGSMPSNTYIFLPDRAHPSVRSSSVQGGHKQRGGGIYFVDIFVRKASLHRAALAGDPRGRRARAEVGVARTGREQQAQRVAADQREMTRSQQIAAAVALRAAGYRVRAMPTGALVEQVAGDAPAAGKLLPTDVIVAAAGKRVRSPADLRAIVGKRKPGSPIRLNVRARLEPRAGRRPHDRGPEPTAAVRSSASSSTRRRRSTCRAR